ncbi:MAG: CHC2 zinc finger domain-containing protein [Candidatus Omnitrophica bacterium]|nr:CHC2 zinc finger domain-containing protein [Candidatus Omnitrophota bacterium]
MINIVQEIAARYGLTRKGEKWVGKCPKCGGSDLTDRFNIRDDGGFKCYSCGDFKGDIITWLREMDGMSCPEAHQAAGIDCRVGASCQAWDTCRLGSGKGGGKTARRPRPVGVPDHGKAPALPAARPGAPDQAWEVWATELVGQAEKALPGQKAAMTWLRSRGIDTSAAGRFRLGWLGRDSKVNRARIGLSPEKDGRTELWVPSGLLIPVLDGDGRIHRLRVRRSAWTRKRFLPDLKYVWLEGSGQETMAIRPVSGRVRGAVICEAELDAMACAAAHPEVLAVALGTVRGGISCGLRRDLEAAPVILVALDADPGKDGKPGPGPEAVKVWLREYRQARFWPVPAGKDPGDYAKDHQGDLRAWLEAGLPPAVAHDPMSCPGGKKFGGERGCSGDRRQETEGKTADTREGGMATDAVVIPAVEPGGVPLEREPEVVELIGLLREHRAWVVREGCELRAWFPEVPAAMYEATSGGRRRIRELLYTGAVVPFVCHLLQPGKYDAAAMARFVGVDNG